MDDDERGAGGDDRPGAGRDRDVGCDLDVAQVLGVDPESDGAAVEIAVDASATDDADAPAIEPGTRVDCWVHDRPYPTAKRRDGRYVAWWVGPDAPALDDPATTEWVTAPTRFLAAGTLHELWERPSAFAALGDE